VIGLGIGTTAGGMLTDGAGSFIKDERGAVVLSRLEPVTLQELARLTGGVYREASGWVDLAALLRATVEAGQAGAFAAAGRVQRLDRFQWLLAPALLLLAWSLWREMPVPAPLRPRTLRPSPASLGVLTALFVSITAPAPLPATEAPAPAAVLSATIARLAARERLQGDDWGALAEQTITYGQADLAAGEKPLIGPVYDALLAVDRGERLDPQARDWPRLREELLALLDDDPPPEPQPDDAESPEESEADDSSEDQGQGEQDSSTDSEGQSDSSADSEAGEGNPSEGESGEGDDSATDSPPPAGPEAFGDMHGEPEPRDDAPPLQDAPTQTVGGQPDRAPSGDDPALTALLQKLEEVRQQDSPARLFQLLQDPRQPPPPPSGRNW
jgi:Ca-activated chloride channel homolog